MIYIFIQHRIFKFQDFQELGQTHHLLFFCIKYEEKGQAKVEIIIPQSSNILIHV